MKRKPLHQRIKRGHQPHRSGAGKHEHKATARNRTRSQVRERAIGEQGT